MDRQTEAQAAKGRTKYRLTRRAAAADSKDADGRAGAGGHADYCFVP